MSAEQSNGSVASTEPKQKSMLVSALFMLALIAVTYYFVFRNHSVFEMFSVLQTVNPWYMLVSFFLIVCYFYLQGLAFQIPLRSLGNKQNLLSLIGVALVGFYFSGITPSSTGGQPMQLYHLNKRGISPSDATLTLLLTNIVYQMVVMLFGLFMLFFRFQFVSETIIGMKALIIFGYVIAGSLLAILILAALSRNFTEKIVASSVRFLARLRLIKNKDRVYESAYRQLESYHSGAAHLRKQPLLFLQVFLITALQMSCYFAIPFFIYKSFGLQGAHLVDLLAIQAILFVAVAYVPLPGSVGASEKGFVTFFSIFFSKAHILPAMLLSRGITFYLPMLVSGVTVLMMQLKKPKRADV